MKTYILMLALVAGSPALASAQHTPQSVLAQICLHEASVPVRAEDPNGWPIWGRTSDHTVEWGADCWIIHEVLLLGASRMAHGRYVERLEDPHFARLYVSFALQHSEGVFTPVGTDTNRWARDVHPPFAEPEGWARRESRCVDGVCTLVPVGMRWSHARAGAAYAWELAEEIIRHGLDTVTHWTVCREPVDTWGGRMDRDHAAEQGFVPVVCDPSANDGYAYPSRIQARTREPEHVSTPA